MILEQIKKLSLNELVTALHDLIVSFGKGIDSLIEDHNELSLNDINELRDHIKARLEGSGEKAEAEKFLKLISLFKDDKRALELMRKDVDEWLEFLDTINEHIGNGSDKLSGDEEKNLHKLREELSNLQSMLRGESYLQEFNTKTQHQAPIQNNVVSRKLDSIEKLIDEGRFEDALSIASRKDLIEKPDHKKMREDLEKVRPLIIEGVEKLLSEGKIKRVLKIIGADPNFFSSHELYELKPSALKALAKLIEDGNLSEAAQVVNAFYMTNADTEILKPKVLKVVVTKIESGHMLDVSKAILAFRITPEELGAVVPREIKKSLSNLFKGKSN